MRRRCFRALDLASRRILRSMGDIALVWCQCKGGAIFLANGRNDTYATFSTPIDSRALQWSISSAQHFWTRRAAKRKGLSSPAATEFSEDFHSH